MGIQRAISIVPYLTPEEVYRMAEAASGGRNGERDKLLILLLFETGLRVSEALSLTPRLLGQHNGKPVIHLEEGQGQQAADGCLSRRSGPQDKKLRLLGGNRH